MEFHDSFHSLQNLQVHRKPKNTRVILCPSFTHWIIRKPNNQHPSRSPGRSPGRARGAGPWRRVTPVYGLSTKIGGRQAVRQPWTPRTRHPFFFQPKKKMFTLKSCDTTNKTQHAKCLNSWEYRPISKRIARKQSNLTLKRTWFFVVRCLILFLARKTQMRDLSFH